MDQEPTPSAPTDSAALRDRAIGDLSLTFLLDRAASPVGELKPRDELLLLAINQANIAPFARQPLPESPHGGLDQLIVDEQRRPVSVNAIANSMGMPFETVRRRILYLQSAGACIVGDQGVIVSQEFLESPTYLAVLRGGHQHLLAFYRGLNADDLLNDLPASTYRIGDALPLRAAARLISDYVLRLAEQLIRMAGDLMGALVLLGVLRGGAGPRGASITSLSTRLRIPAETVRRHATALVGEGRCARGARGLTVTEEMLAQPAWVAFFRENAANVQRLFAGLAERGVIDAWRAFGAAN